MKEANLKGWPNGEPLCINTQKVYDWILNDSTFNLTIDIADLPIGVSNQDVVSVSCEVEPLSATSIEEVAKENREFIIDGELLTLQLVTLRKTFNINLYATLTNGTTVAMENNPFPFSRCEQVVLCAPEGVMIEGIVTDVDCFVCDFGPDFGPTNFLTDVQITVQLCQSIQSVNPVTLEVIADFCEPREQLQLEHCPEPIVPTQCPVVFPGKK